MCQSGAREVQQKVLAKLKSEKMQVFVVWLPRYQGDDRNKAVLAANIVSDPRATHYWDGKGALGVRFGKTLDLPDNRNFAWDVYLAFDHTTQWKESLPQPAYWMHQLGPDTTEKRRLDGNQFRRAIRQLIQDASNHTSSFESK